MKKIHLLLPLLLLAISPALYAQVFPYNFTVSTQAYTDLEGATILSTETWDDPEYVVPIGFDFDFFESTSNTLNFIGLGGTIIFGGDIYVDIVDLLVAYGSDLTDRGYNDSQVLSPISYKVEGDAGSKVFKLEWKNAGFYNELYYGSSTSFVNLQLWLFEGSNNIEIRFGPNSIKNDDEVHDYGGTPLVSFIEQYDYSNYSSGNVWYLNGDQDNPSVELTDLANFEYIVGVDDDPADGTVYRFEFDLTNVKESDDLRKSVSIQPTLAHDYVYINLNDPGIRNGVLSLYNQLGQALISQSLQYGTQRLSLENLGIGQYYVTVKTENAVYTEKILKQ